ncbi:N-acetylmuramoyl-L-alanine amidase [Cytobacillus firmus]|uniref:N-acetylmuramoyl-L-alanine amidase n=2 Tax=Cytobacillus TaxID=2675230 RepID=A0A366JHY4_CYTFI|nr:N-acetylmuramoyl-L-alanine amidase [Cytobacillus firmus]TDX36391.1 N-acetylmuramoyl-L-alanine amidase [Cytobacillus oceanisediminis]
MLRLVLDPGHGGIDPGAQGNGLQEKNLTLQIANRIKDILNHNYDNVSIRMSRTGDQTVSLSERTSAANEWGANFFLSIHINAGGGTGYEDYVYPGVGFPTTSYQNNIHSEILKLADFKDRGKKQTNFHILRETNFPAVLTENGFIDNNNDAAKLKLSTYIEKLARGHVNGIAKSFKLPKKNTAVYHSVVSGDTVYSLS